MMSPAEHYKIANSLLWAAAESLDKVRVHMAKPSTTMKDANSLLATVAVTVRLANAHAVMATVPEGVYQMAKEDPDA